MVDGMASSNISIRKTNKHEEVLILNAIIFPEDDLDVGSRTSHWIARDLCSEKPVGFCSVSDYGYGILFLSRSGLLPEHRGRGIQRRFIRVREMFASRNGFTKIITYTMKDNYQSMASLIKMGYQVYTPEFNYVGSNVMYFIKEI